MSDLAMPTPVEVGRANQHDVKIRWQDGHESIYPARALRLACPCAGCVDEVTGQRRLTDAMVAHNVAPVAIQLVGRYAITIEWNDGHRTGIYPFELLRAMCPCCKDSE
jgi:ATP-binding protein involved in chromosome partitioning